eukprot:m.185842 g.185842  ORF g.185842 m.185842 type:complete len:113 (-) comp21587_c0_seq4:42-380(-)
MDFQAQLQHLLALFEQWPGEHRDRFFREMLGLCVPQEEDPLSSHLRLLHVQQAPASATPDPEHVFRAQVDAAVQMFTEWNVLQRNYMLNALEQLDLTRVNAFIDNFARLRWR